MKLGCLFYLLGCESRKNIFLVEFKAPVNCEESDRIPLDLSLPFPGLVFVQG